MSLMCDMQIRKYCLNDIIYKEEDEVSFMYLIKSGEIEINELANF